LGIVTQTGYKMSDDTPRRAVLNGAAMVLAVVVSGSAATAAELKLGAGDTLSLTFIGENNQTFPVPVEVDGNGWFPVIGAVPVAGMSLADVRAIVAEAYSASSITFDPNQPPRRLSPEQVFLSVGQYRPIYVSGEVGLPVVIDFRPGLSVQQALTIAGSQQALERGAGTGPDRVTTLGYELARIESRIWRLRTILGESTEEEFKAFFESRSPRQRELAELEIANLRARDAARDREAEVLEAGIERARNWIAALDAQKANEEEAKRLDDEVAANIMALSERGLVRASQTVEARQAALASATRLLQLESQIENAWLRLFELEAQAETLAISAEAGMYAELADELVRYQGTLAELSALQTAAAMAQMQEATVASRVLITRDTGEILEVGTEDTEVTLLPGDVLKVLLESQTQ
jgi:polysaccharide export outer membrane protein